MTYQSVACATLAAKLIAKGLRERQIEFEGQSGAPILDVGQTYIVSLWMDGSKGKVQTRRAVVLNVQMPLVRFRDEETKAETVINIASPAFIRAIKAK